MSPPLKTWRALLTGPWLAALFVCTSIQHLSSSEMVTAEVLVGGRGSPSFTSQLNLSPFCGIGGARRGCVARVKGLVGGV